MRVEDTPDNEQFVNKQASTDKYSLDVYLHRNLVGQLVQDEYGDMVFDYAKSWLDNPKAQVLSLSLPLREARFTRRECRGFFAGILPETHQRDVLAKNLGVSAINDFALLSKIGGECAGAVTFLATGTPLPDEKPVYRALSQDDLGVILATLPKRPLMADDEDVRLSLAGAQDKIAVHLDHGTFSLPLNNAPSTHIIKPAVAHLTGLVFNEAFCMTLAAKIGLPTANVAIGQAGDIDYLLIERYDRVVEKSDTITEKTGPIKILRLHQEDICQALGIWPEHKYQNEGGPSLKQCFALLRTHTSNPLPAILQLLDAVIFNFLIGNHDAHGKNFSLLYHEGKTYFAPLYDVLSTVYYPDLSLKMAMKIGSKYRGKDVLPRHFEQLAEEAGLSKQLVKKRLITLADEVIALLDTSTILEGSTLKSSPSKNVSETGLQIVNTLSKLIKTRCKAVHLRFG